ncbi:hypothetical protein ISF6_4259 [Piscinibacter sakaiensis]|uniref:3-keto-5-aminohexanoate cleavage enzyme n=1 Tax=Piscinibacter sakaiensis TaxID=1547922 RepID=A0A0K8P780_PISS1|nr:hypothetical protein ISF6_4259 [Piscinibacter sakaiensis]
MIEAAINGARSKADNPHVPLSSAEMLASIAACVDAGASVIHVHAGQPVVGSSGHHDPAPYLALFAAARARHPGLALYPTLPGGGPGTTMAGRLAHVFALARAGLLSLVPIDPGTMNYGQVGPDGQAPVHDRVYQTSFEDVAWGFAACRQASLGCTLSLFEPGFARLMEAHRRAGTLPQPVLAKLEFSAGRRLFGLAPDATGVAAWLRLFDARRIPWMVTLRDGDVGRSLAGLAIRRGGHVRVGLEDHGGPGTPRNEDLVAHVARLAIRAGRRPAHPEELPELLAQAGAPDTDVRLPETP